MSYTNLTRDTAERTIKEARHHWIIYAPAVFGLLLGILTSAYITKDGGLLVMFTVALGILSIFVQKSAEMTVTNKRIIVKTGLFSRNAMEISIDRVESITVNQPILGRLLGYGRISFSGTGISQTPMSTMTVADPFDFRAAVIFARDRYLELAATKRT